MAKILIIEDMYEIRMMMRSFMVRKGYKVMDAGDGDEGLRLIEKETPDVIITDILMPGKDGFETIRDIRKNGLDVPVIIVTGYEEIISQDKALELGIRRVIIKPFSADELIDAVEDALKISQSLSHSLS